MIYEEPRMNWKQLFPFIQLPSRWASSVTDQSPGTAEKDTQKAEICVAPELSEIKHCYKVAMCTRIPFNKYYVL